MALTVNSFDSASGSGNTDFFQPVTVNIPGTPQAGDRLVIVAVGIGTVSNSTIGFTSGSGTGWTTHEQIGVGIRSATLASRDWQSGDPTTETLEYSSGGKWLFVGAYLVRPGGGNTVGFVDDGSGQGTSSGSTDTVTLGTAPASGDVILAGHSNDDKQTAYSSWDHGTFSLTKDAELDEGGGSPANWSTGSFASGVTTQTGTSVSTDHDDTGVDWAMVAGAFDEIAGGPKTGTASGSVSTTGAATGNPIRKGTGSGSVSATGAATGLPTRKGTAAGSVSAVGSATGAKVGADGGLLAFFAGII